MSYNSVTDFLALIRGTSGGEVIERIPGLDYVVAALVRMGLFRVYVGQVQPLVNQATTVWLKPSVPSWVAEGVVYLWNASTATYEVATPALWANLIAPSGYLFQSAAAASNVVNDGVSILAVQRVAPTATSLVLPNLRNQWLTGRKLQIVDWSTAVVNHAITLTAPDGSTIMQLAQWQLLSNAVQLAGVTLQPCPDLNGWIIAP